MKKSYSIDQQNNRHTNQLLCLNPIVLSASNFGTSKPFKNLPSIIIGGTIKNALRALK
nr:MAG TPA: hypothetical protein [Caudoviricetes sp.]